MGIRKEMVTLDLRNSSLYETGVMVFGMPKQNNSRGEYHIVN
jgi:hypothetical protein